MSEGLSERTVLLGCLAFSLTLGGAALTMLARVAGM